MSPRAHPRRRRESGQASLDYVAILAVVAIVMAATVAGSAIFAPGVANAVIGKVRHGLCVVTGQVCAEVAERPCVVRSARDERRETLSIALLQLGTGRVLLRERLSDGTLRLTVLNQGRIGVTAGAGGTLHLKLGGKSVDVGAHAQGTIAGILGKGDVFEVRTAAEADAIVERLRAGGSSTDDFARRILGGGDDLPAPDAKIRELGVDASAEGTLSREASVGAGIDVGAAIGQRKDTGTGETTTYFRVHAGLSAFGDAILARADANLEGDAILSVTTDRAGKPKDLSVVVGAHGEASVGTSGDLAAALGDHTASVGGTRWEAEARASLQDPDVLAALRAWTGNPTSTDAARNLGQVLHDHARIDMRTYARQESSDHDGLEGSLGVRFGVGIDEETESMQLQSAVTRPPGGLWEPRLDCVT